MLGQQTIQNRGHRVSVTQTERQITDAKGIVADAVSKILYVYLPIILPPLLEHLSIQTINIPFLPNCHHM